MPDGSGAAMQNIRDWSVREIARYCRRNLFFAHLTDGADRPDRQPELNDPLPMAKARVIADRNRPSVVFGEVGQFLAVTAAIFLLIVIAISIH